MWSLRPEHFKMIYAPEPPPDEQDAIVRFLDWANGRLDRAIRAKRKVIALLNEQKQAIIHRAVTRGLDPSVPLKPSGVPWLADVPAHWTVMPLKHAFTSMDYGISDPTFDAGRIHVLGMGQIKDGEITVPEDGGVNTVDPSLFLKDGDLLFNRTNSAALVGKVGIFRGHNTPVTFASYLVRLRPKSGFDSEYLNFVLNCSVILNVARQSSIPSLHQSNLNPTRYGRLAIAVPCLEEQQQILRHLIKVCQPLNDAIRMAGLTAQRIAEYRTRLVADVVTGKLDVREAAEKLPIEDQANDPGEELVEDDSEMIEDEITEPAG
jgi:type I restriction enzyme S subunit